MKETSITESLMKSGGVWFPEAVSNIARNIDVLFYFILILSCITFAGVLFALVTFVWQYRKKEPNQLAKAQVTHNNVLEVTWTVIPLLLVMIIFFWGFRGYMDLSVSPKGAMDVRVIGQKWNWIFDYPKSGIKSPGELVVPVDTPIRLIMSSRDVIHSFFVPNFRIKKDVVPNRYTTIWFEADKQGQYQVFCTEYCGDEHSTMLAVVKVVSKKEFEEWVATSGKADDDLPLVELGEKLYTKQACNACHSLDGTVRIGPSWKGVYGTKRQLEDGRSVLVDDNYIRESIVNPKAKITKGYPPVMNSYQGLLSDREINGIIEYIKSLAK